MIDRNLPRWLLLGAGALLLVGAVFALVVVDAPPLALIQLAALGFLAYLWIVQSAVADTTDIHRQVMIEASQALSSKANLDEIYDYVAGILLQRIQNTDKVVVHKLDDLGQRLLPRYCSQPDCVRPAGLPADKGVAGQALKEIRTIVVNDVARDPRFLPLSSNGLRSLLVAPLVSGGQAVGTISLNSHQPNNFSHADEVLATSLATMVSGCLKKTSSFAQNSQELFYIESLVHRITDGIVLLDAERRLVRYNPALAHLLGAGVNHLVGQKVDPASDEPGLQLLARLIEGLPDPLRGSYERQVEIQEPVHAILLVRVDSFDTPEEQGRVIILVQDKTEDHELIRAEAELMVAASREMLPALDSIRGHATLIKSLAGSSQAAGHWPGVIQEESARLMGLGQDLAVLHAIHADRLHPHPEPIDLRALLTELQQTLGPLTRMSQVDLRVKVQPNLAQMPLDGDLVRHALSNLIQNAIRRSNPGGAITIEVETSLTDVTLTVSDDGASIPEDAQARIFHGLFRSNGAEPAHPSGTGLGLYVARRMIEAHGGTLWMPQTEGALDSSAAGAVFRCVLPLEQGATNGYKPDLWREVVTTF